MTSTQSNRVAGIRAIQAVRGVSLEIAGTTVVGLIEQFSSPGLGNVAESGIRQLDPQLRSACRVAILKSDLVGVPVVVGDVFVDSDNSTDYRITRIESDGVDVLTRFTCEREARS